MLPGDGSAGELLAADGREACLEVGDDVVDVLGADVKSLVIHPASTTHSQLTDEELAEQQIYQNTIRLSIGTEHIDDIIADLEAGFAAVRGE